MKLPDRIVLLDSLGDIKTDNTFPILVCGSHCGDDGTFARKLKSCNVKAVFLNNAGIGKNQAGIRGLIHYEAEGILACAVDHNSAEIGVASDSLECGIISHINRLAEVAGIRIGDTVIDAVARINHATDCSSLELLSKNLEQHTRSSEQHSLDLEQYSRSSEPQQPEKQQSKIDHKKLTQLQIDGKTITVTDSITFLNETNAGDIVVCGSHGGISAGEYALKHRVKAVFFNDAGIGKNNSGIKSLETLSNAGIPACTVDCMSAEIFNGLDMFENGIISVCNQLATTCGIKETMTAKEAIQKI